MSLLLAALLSHDVAHAGPGPHGSIGLHLTGAPRIARGDDRFSGLFAGGLGELSWGRAVGRAQLDLGLPSTLGFGGARGMGALVGSVGVRLGVVEEAGPGIDLMASAGGTWLFYEVLSDRFGDGSPQLGLTVAPRWVLTDRLAVAVSLRHLVGASVAGGTAITRTDIGGDVLLRLF